MIYIRGQPEDFDHWAQLGNRGWSWDDVLPFFRKAENWEGKETRCTQGRPADSPRHRATSPHLCQAAVEAGRQMGWETREDVTTCRRGWATSRLGAADPRRAGGAPAPRGPICIRRLKRPNLQVVTGALVHRVLFDGNRAVGVEFSRGGGTERVDGGGRGDPVRRCDRLAAYPADFRRRRSDHLERAGMRCITHCAVSGATSRTTILARVSCEVQGAPS